MDPSSAREIALAFLKFGATAYGGLSAIWGVMAAFLPAFLLMLGIVPVLERVRALQWTKAAMKGIAPAVIGVLLVSLGQMAPHALPDPLAVVIFGVAAAAMLGWEAGPLKLLLAGALAGALRYR